MTPEILPWPRALASLLLLVTALRGSAAPLDRLVEAALEEAQLRPNALEERLVRAAGQHLLSLRLVETEAFAADGSRTQKGTRIVGALRGFLDVVVLVGIEPEVDADVALVERFEAIIPSRVYNVTGDWTLGTDGPAELAMGASLSLVNAMADVYDGYGKSGDAARLARLLTFRDWWFFSGPKKPFYPEPKSRYASEQASRAVGARFVVLDEGTTPEDCTEIFRQIRLIPRAPEAYSPEGKVERLDDLAARSLERDVRRFERLVASLRGHPAPERGSEEDEERFRQFKQVFARFGQARGDWARGVRALRRLEVVGLIPDVPTLSDNGPPPVPESFPAMDDAPQGIFGQS